MRNLTRSMLASALAAAALAAPMQAQAGLFDDDEARRAILDIRARIDAVNARVDAKADKSTSLDLANQNEQLRGEIARLRGQIEVLTNELANEQRRQKDFYADLDGRLRKVEPQRMTVDGREVDVQQSEQQSYDAALAQFKVRLQGRRPVLLHLPAQLSAVGLCGVGAVLAGQCAVCGPRLSGRHHGAAGCRDPFSRQPESA